jgi:23S rRNA pseudouridine2605 synthase
MFDAVGLSVEKLRRTAIGPLKLGRLATGMARHLSRDEVAAIRSAVDL